ncbi:hypothetical protein KDK88_09430 [bacterium]|nr:hypothetical protein [bacterium]
MARVRLLLPLLLLIAARVPAAPPADWTVGGDVRVRGYHLENMWDVDSTADADRWSVWRHRTRLWAAAELDRGAQAYVRLANQHFGEGVTDAGAWEEDNKSDKVFVDNAWVRLPDLLGLPLELTAGRMDVRYGSGFVLFDGQSQTASTSAYLDGVKARLAPATGVTLDLLHFKDQENRRDDASHDDVTLSGAYLTLGDGQPREAYLLRRVNQALDREVWTGGARVGGAAGRLTWRAEAALQRGDADALRTLEAWGATADLRLGVDAAGTALLAGFTGLSGDDPATAGVDERWDVVHGGWPRLGDLPAWLYLNVGPHNAVSGFDPGYADGSSRPGEVVYGNLIMPWAGVELRPRADVTARAWWSSLRAHRSAAASDRIGELLQLSVKHRWSADVTLALYAARLWPGDAYGPDADPATEVFWEINLAF